MVRSVFIPYSVKMSREAAFLSRSTGEMDAIQTRLKAGIEEAESELDQLLNTGYTVVTSHLLDASDAAGLLIVLHRPDAVFP